MRVVAIVVASVALGSGITYAATGWRVLAKGEDDGQDSPYASASVDVTKPLALRVRSTGRQVQLGAFFSCELADRTVRSGQAVLLTVAGAKSCSVTASALASNGGPVTVFIDGRKR